MKTTHRQLRKGITWLLLILEGLVFLFLLILLSIDLPAATTTTMLQFKYFISVAISMLLTYCCHNLLINFGNKKVLEKLIGEEK